VLQSDFIRAANEEPGGPYFLLEVDSLVGWYFWICLAGRSDYLQDQVSSPAACVADSFSLVPFTIISYNFHGLVSGLSWMPSS